ncbi:MAG: hypothetical protein BYD32DRAFT_417010 [Podila humilis]|nr:MAG: hypothetical protein BYD32DRAFT_417010 [Podila humilis]
MKYFLSVVVLVALAAVAGASPLIHIGVPVTVKNNDGLANGAGIGNGLDAANGAGLGNRNVGANAGVAANSYGAPNSGKVSNGAGGFLGNLLPSHLFR